MRRPPQLFGLHETLTRAPYASLEEVDMAAKGKENRIVITLACNECKSRNYVTQKNKKNDPDRMELDKYCPRCRVHRAHRETK